MALETLKGVKEIGGFNVAHHYLDGGNYASTMVGEYVTVDHSDNSIKFDIQDGPIKENGVNGCQVDTIIEAAQIIVKGLIVEYPCRESAAIIRKLEEALLWSYKRKLDREKRGVEGYNKK